MGSSPAIFALGFSQLAMLGWLAAAALPLVIHLWNRRKHRETIWAAMDFLLAAIQKNARRLRIEQWLLLAVRTAVVVLVVLAVAGPYQEQATAPFASGRPTHKLIVVDGSYSMGYRPADISRFERARELAGEIVEHSRQGDAFTLVMMASPPRVIVDKPSFSHADFLLEVQGLKYIHTDANLPATLAKVEQIVQAVAAEHSRLVQHEVYFLTDLGRNTWGPVVSDDAISTQLDRLAQLANLWVVDLGQPTTENFAVSSLVTAEPFATTISEIPFRATVRSYAQQPQRRTLEFLVDGERMGDETIDVPPGGEATANFRHRFTTAGDHAVEVRLKGDSLSVDNHRWLALPVKEKVETLIVNGEASADAANYLRFALDPDSGKPGSVAAEQSPIRVTVVSESALLESDLSQYDGVFLSNVAQFTAGEAQALSNYVHAGGSLVFFLGDRVQPESYNEHLVRGGQDERLLPVALNQPSEAASQFHFDPLTYRHPIIEPFRGNERAGLLQTPISKYFRMTPVAGESVEIALAIQETKDPAIVTAAVGQGRVTVIALPPSLESLDASRRPWTLLVATQSFQPIVQEILAYTLQGQLQTKAAGVGETIGGNVPLAAANTSMSIDIPENRSEQIRAVADGHQSRWSYDETWYSGIYRANVAETGASDQIVAVNVELGESDLTKVSPDELPRSLTVLVQGQDFTTSGTSDLAPRGGLHRPLLYAALVLLLIESGLAWLLGYRSA
jgi:aerotolerance regulator-like protein/VWA domain-containing protein